MSQVTFEASVIRDDDSLTVWVTASVTPCHAFDALDEYWEQDSACINDCTDENGEYIPLTREEEREFEQTAIGHHYSNEAKNKRLTPLL